MTFEPYKVLIIGCGNMAGGFDLLQSEETLPLGHAKAFSKHGGFDIKACIDPDAKKLEAFQKRWHIPKGFANLQALSAKAGQFDVISICSPTNSHAIDLQLALALKPKLIFCEKPITNSLHETYSLVEACSAANVLLAVNYSRRWSPQVIQLKDELTNGLWGSVRSVSAVYNKGVLNNGSHMLDLLSYLFGPLHLSNVGQVINDFVNDDPTIDATLLDAQDLPIHLNVASAKDYALFEMQIVTENGVINMEDGGARWRFRRAQPSEKIEGYKFLNSGEWLEPSGSYSLTGAVANIYAALQTGAPLASTGLNTIEAQTLCEEIKMLALIKTKDQINKKVTL
jgi:predicted dehydrogenase